MDFDSSSKFISSLAKFLQSLCNGYVEFNNGVEVIGHIYINVDTGKKIDYVLNEKVCKTDENSVTFISNSFHAQPAEKPKPPEKLPKLPVESESTQGSPQQDEIIIMDEPESDNIGTLPPHQQHRPRPSKRPHQQSFSSNHRQQSKFSRTEQSYGHNGSPHNSNTSHLESGPSHLGGAQPPGSSAASSALNVPSNPSVFPQPYSDPSNSQHATEERDIKPVIDTDLSAVKQEYDPSQQGGEEHEGYDDSQGAGGYSGMQYDQYYEDSSQGGQGYGQMGGVSQDDYYQGGSGMAGDVKGGDSAGGLLGSSKGSAFCPVEGCKTKFVKQISQLKQHWKEKHEEIVAIFHCSVCIYKAKRKSNVLRHYRERHEKDSKDYAKMVGHVEYVPNGQFVNPYPYTYEDVFG